MGEGLLWNIHLQKEELEDRKFLGILNQDSLKVLEERHKTDLGTHKRNRRPFIGYYSGKWLFVCFLTTAQKSQTVRVDINLCDKKGCRFNFQETSYVFYDRKNRGFYLYQLPKDFIKYSFCGFCKDLDHIYKIPVL